MFITWRVLDVGIGTEVQFVQGRPVSLSEFGPCELSNLSLAVCAKAKPNLAQVW